MYKMQCIIFCMLSITKINLPAFFFLNMATRKF